MPTSPCKPRRNAGIFLKEKAQSESPNARVGALRLSCGCAPGLGLDAGVELVLRGRLGGGGESRREVRPVLVAQDVLATVLVDRGHVEPRRRRVLLGLVLRRDPDDRLVALAHHRGRHGLAGVDRDPELAVVLPADRGRDVGELAVLHGEHGAVLRAVHDRHLDERAVHDVDLRLLPLEVLDRAVEVRRDRLGLGAVDAGAAVLTDEQRLADQRVTLGLEARRRQGLEGLARLGRQRDALAVAADEQDGARVLVLGALDRAVLVEQVEAQIEHLLGVRLDREALVPRREPDVGLALADRRGAELVGVAVSGLPLRVHERLVQLGASLHGVDVGVDVEQEDVDAGLAVGVDAGADRQQGAGVELAGLELLDRAAHAVDRALDGTHGDAVGAGLDAGGNLDLVDGPEEGTVRIHLLSLQLQYSGVPASRDARAFPERTWRSMPEHKNRVKCG